MLIKDITNHRQLAFLQDKFGFSPFGSLRHFLIDNRYLFIQQIDRNDIYTPFYYSISDKRYKTKVTPSILAEVLSSDLIDHELMKIYGYKCNTSPSGITYIVPNN